MKLLRAIDGSGQPFEIARIRIPHPSLTDTTEIVKQWASFEHHSVIYASIDCEGLLNPIVLVSGGLFYGGVRLKYAVDQGYTHVSSVNCADSDSAIAIGHLHREWKKARGLPA